MANQSEMRGKGRSVSVLKRENPSSAARRACRTAAQVPHCPPSRNLLPPRQAGPRVTLAQHGHPQRRQVAPAPDHLGLSQRGVLSRAGGSRACLQVRTSAASCSTSRQRRPGSSASGAAAARWRCCGAAVEQGCCRGAGHSGAQLVAALGAAPQPGCQPVQQQQQVVLAAGPWNGGGDGGVGLGVWGRRKEGGWAPTTCARQEQGRVARCCRCRGHSRAAVEGTRGPALQHPLGSEPRQ